MEIKCNINKLHIQKSQIFTGKTNILQINNESNKPIEFLRHAGINMRRVRVKVTPFPKLV